MSQVATTRWTEADVSKALKSFKRSQIRAFNKKKAEGDVWVPLVNEYERWSVGKDVPGTHDLFQIYQDWGTVCREEFGIKTMGGRMRFTYFDALASLQRAKRHFEDKPVYRPDYEKWAIETGEVSWAVIRRYFVTWIKACEAVGMTPGRQKTLQGKEDEVLLAVQETCEGRPKSLRQFNRDRAPGVPRAERIALMFGGWPQSLQAAGVHGGYFYAT
jgi:hypothetical protein